MPGVFQKSIQIATAACLATITFANSGRAETLVSLAVFDFELVDTSYEGEKNGVNADESKRLALIGALLRERPKESGRYTLVDMAPAAAKIKDVGIIHSCNGCRRGYREIVACSVRSHRQGVESQQSDTDHQRLCPRRRDRQARHGDASSAKTINQSPAPH